MHPLENLMKFSMVSVFCISFLFICWEVYLCWNIIWLIWVIATQTQRLFEQDLYPGQLIAIATLVALYQATFSDHAHGINLSLSGFRLHRSWWWRKKNVSYISNLQIVYSYRYFCFKQMSEFWSTMILWCEKVSQRKFYFCLLCSAGFCGSCVFGA